jgi:LysM repeat protein
MLEQKNKSRARVRVYVFCVLSIGILGLMALLMQGCRKATEPEPTPGDTNTLPSTNVESTNVPGVPTNLPPTQPPEMAPVPGAQEYVVAKGDTLSTIGKKFGVSVKAIEAANPGVEPTKLKIGQKLQIPASSGAGAPPGGPAASAPAPAEGEQVYTVKSGDTLTKIAAQFGTTLKSLRSDNNLTTDRIKVGQKLKIPGKAAAPNVPAAPSAPTPVPAAAPTA